MLINDYSYIYENDSKLIKSNQNHTNIENKVNYQNNPTLKRVFSLPYNQKQIKICTNLSKYFQIIPVFKPTSIYKLIWDFIMICTISYLLFVIPIHISFNMPYKTFTSSILVDAACSMIFIDIGISINTGYFDKGNHVTDRLKILKNYIKTSLITEILGCLSLIAHFFSWEGYIQ